MSDIFIPSAGPSAGPGLPGAIAFGPPASLHTYGFTACWTPPRTFSANLTTLPFSIDQNWAGGSPTRHMTWPRPGGIGFMCAINYGGTAAQRAAYFRSYDQRSAMVSQLSFGAPWRVTNLTGIENTDDYVIVLTCQTGTGTFTWSGGTISASTTQPILIRIGGDCVVQNAIRLSGGGVVWLSVNSSGRCFISGNAVVDLPSSGSASVVSPGSTIGAGGNVEITESNILGGVRQGIGWSFDATTKDWSTIVNLSNASGAINPNFYNIPLPTASVPSMFSRADGGLYIVETVNASPPSWPTGPYAWYFTDQTYPSPNQILGFMQYAQNTAQAGLWNWSGCKLGNWLIGSYIFTKDHNIAPGYDAVVPSGYQAGVASVVWSAINGVVERACVAYLGTNIATLAPYVQRFATHASISGGQLLAWVGLTVGEAVGGGVTDLRVLFGDGSQELIVPYTASTGARNFMLCTQGKSIATSGAGWRVGAVALN